MLGGAERQSRSVADSGAAIKLVRLAQMRLLSNHALDRRSLKKA
jgi:hypothetical protein